MDTIDAGLVFEDFVGGQEGAHVLAGQDFAAVQAKAVVPDDSDAAAIDTGFGHVGGEIEERLAVGKTRLVQYESDAVMIDAAAL